MSPYPVILLTTPVLSLAPCPVDPAYELVPNTAATPKPRHKMAATPAPLHKMAAIPESRPDMAAMLEPPHKMVTSQKPLYKMAATPAVMDIKLQSLAFTDATQVFLSIANVAFEDTKAFQRDLKLVSSVADRPQHPKSLSTGRHRDCSPCIGSCYTVCLID